MVLSLVQLACALFNTIPNVKVFLFIYTLSNNIFHPIFRSKDRKRTYKSHTE
nr:MAG TPA: hypothetical protein [Caudoviricetes sp.]